VDLKVLRELFRAGVLDAAHVTPAPMAENSWMVLVDRIDGEQECLITQRGQEKRYKGLSSAMEDVRRIGFKEVRVVLPNQQVPIKR